MPHHQLQIQNFKTWVSLGCTSEERSFLQPIEVDIDLKFQTPPPGTQSDRLEETVCYAELCTAIEAVAKSKPYALIEHLGQMIFELIKEKWGSQGQLQIRIHKLRPPVPHLNGGVSYVISDEPLS